MGVAFAAHVACKDSVVFSQANHSAEARAKLRQEILEGSPPAMVSGSCVLRNVGNQCGERPGAWVLGPGRDLSHLCRCFWSLLLIGKGFAGNIYCSLLRSACSNVRSASIFVFLMFFPKHSLKKPRTRQRQGSAETVGNGWH